MVEAIQIWLLLLFSVGLILLSRYFLMINQVSKSSMTLKKLDALNSEMEHQFTSSYDQTIQINIRCKSKADFDGMSLRHCLSRYMGTHYKAYAGLYSHVLKDRELYQQYLQRYETLREWLGSDYQIPGTIPMKRYLQCEKALFEKRKLRSPHFRLDVRKTYTSPKKRNHYSDQEFFYDQTFIDICDELYQQERRKKKIDKERRALTNELRYQILQRDGFRCQICGRSQQDGTILHIDHIFPVSKGGKTEPSNLRVLCVDCNSGKSDRYDPNGPN